MRIIKSASCITLFMLAIFSATGMAAQPPVALDPSNVGGIGAPVPGGQPMQPSIEKPAEVDGIVAPVPGEQPVPPPIEKPAEVDGIVAPVPGEQPSQPTAPATGTTTTSPTTKPVSAPEPVCKDQTAQPMCQSSVVFGQHINTPGCKKTSGKVGTAIACPPGYKVGCNSTKAVCIKK